MGLAGSRALTGLGGKDIEFSARNQTASSSGGPPRPIAARDGSIRWSRRTAWKKSNSTGFSNSHLARPRNSRPGPAPAAGAPRPAGSTRCKSAAVSGGTFTAKSLPPDQETDDPDRPTGATPGPTSSL